MLMRHSEGEVPVKRSRSALILNLAVLAVLAVLGISYVPQRSSKPVAFAAGPGLDGPDIELLEKQNKAFERIIQSITPGIVYIRTEQVIRADQSPLFVDPLFRQFFGDGFSQLPREQKQHALGTGVIFDSNGYIITNNHVIDHATAVEIMLNDKKMFKAKVVGTDPDTDIAVVKIDAKNLPTVSLGDSSTLHVGDTVMAFGNPFGLNCTVTRGAVSALGRSQGRIEAVQDFIQTDAAINPGNSGGALVDIRGQMVGINTAILSGNSGPGGEGGFAGIGFAIPINMAKRTMEALIKTGKVTRGYLGVTIGPVTPELASEFKVPDIAGALVQDVTRGGPADRAGIKPGDVIRKYDGRPVDESDSLLAMVASTNPGATAPVEILRNGEPLNLKVEIDPRPTDLGYTSDRRKIPPSGTLRGVTVQNLTASVRRQLEIPGDVHGVVVTDIDPTSPAAQHLEQGDVIVSVNHHSVNSVAEFNNLAAEVKGQALLRIYHQGQALFVAISPENEDGN